MSAYICNPEHFGILAAFAAKHRIVIGAWDADNSIRSAQAVAKGLARENIRSVAYSYPNDKDGERPGPCLLDAEIEEAAAIYAAHFVEHGTHIGPLDVLKLTQGLSYQSCETPDWRDTFAHQQLEWINGEAIRSLDGYESAPWSFDRPLPEIEALYERHH